MPFGLQGFHLACFNHSGSLDQGEERAASISSPSGAIHGAGGSCHNNPPPPPDVAYPPPSSVLPASR